MISSFWGVALKNQQQQSGQPKQLRSRSQGIAKEAKVGKTAKVAKVAKRGRLGKIAMVAKVALLALGDCMFCIVFVCEADL